MTKLTNEIETVIFQALAHPMRRTIISILNGNTKGLLYTELITELGLPTGKMNYHIQQLEGLIEKNPDQRYVLTSLGKKALNQLRQLQSEVTDEDEKYLSIVAKTQRATLEPTLRSFITIGSAASLIAFFVLASVAYTALTDSDTPVIVFLLLPLLMTVDVTVIVTLVRALRNAPAWLRRLEHRFT